MISRLLAFLLVPIGLGSTLANDAAINDGATGPEPVGWRAGAESIIQMKSENLDIHFGLDTSKVHATFRFVSHKKSGGATQKLGFPDYSRSEREGSVMGPITNMVTKVNGKVVPSELSEGYYREKISDDGSIQYEKAEKPKPDPNVIPEVRRFAWHIIEVKFPPGEEVVVERIYETPSGISAGGESFMLYETRTGGAWRGEIEKLTAEVTLDAAIDPGLIVLEPREGWEISEDKRTLSLEWNNFEPRTDNDRQYFTVTTLDTRKFEQRHKDFPEEYPSLEKFISDWKDLYKKIARRAEEEKEKQKNEAK